MTSIVEPVTAADSSSPLLNSTDGPQAYGSTTSEMQSNNEANVQNGATRQSSLPSGWKEWLTYLPDWLVTIVVTGLFYLLDTTHGFWRDFSLTDTSIQYTYTEHERVPTWALVVISLIAPLVLMPVLNYFTIRSAWDWHNSWLGLILAWGMTGTITNIVKITAGRPRPDLISRCQPMPGSHDAAIFGLVSPSVCTQTNIAILKDGFRSFFSGHSSLSFAGLGFLHFYLAGKLHLYDTRGNAVTAWVALIPLAGAGLIAISRTMDYRHHPGDVIAGSLVGFITAFFSYSQYYPPLRHALSHLPYSPRVPHSTSRVDDPVNQPPNHTYERATDGTVRRRNPTLGDLYHRDAGDITAARPAPGEHGSV